MTVSTVQSEMQPGDSRRTWRWTAWATAIVAGSFLVAVAVIMLASHFRELADHPLTLPDMTMMREHLVKNPDDDAGREKLRQFDLELRRSFFERREFVAQGRWLLLGSAIILVLSLKIGHQLGTEPYLPDPAKNPVAAWPRVAAFARVAVGVSALVTAGVFLGVAGMPRYRLPNFTAQPAVETEEMAPPMVFAQNWASFRGPTGSGVASPVGYPTDWDGPSGRNIVWKQPVPLPGSNSPIVWNDCVFLSGATRAKRDVYCFDAATGSLRWRQGVGAGAAPEDLKDEAGFANSTVATDGHRVYAIFPTGDVAAFDFGGRKAWSRNLGFPDNTYGHASSLVTFRNRLLIQLDQGNNPDESKCALLCLDGRTGKTIWETKRPGVSAWSTPVFIPAESGTQLVLAGNPFVIAYEPETGKEIWRIKCLNGEVAPSPIYAKGRIFVGVEQADLCAIRAEGAKGDVTKTNIAWKYGDDLPDIVSPISSGEIVIIVRTSGTLTCLDAATGEEIWKHEMEVEFNSSPVISGSRIYLADMKGVMHIFDADLAFNRLLPILPAWLRPTPEIARLNIGEPVQASPAFVNGKIYLRGEKNLYCIGSK